MRGAGPQGGGRGAAPSGRARSRPARRGAEVEGRRKEARVQPGPRRAYANGPGSSTRTVPSGSIVRPRVAVSWRSPEPSRRMAKIWSPNGLPPTGSQLDPNSRVPVTLSGTTPSSRSIVHTAGPPLKQPVLGSRPSDGRWVTWRRSPPAVLMEKRSEEHTSELQSLRHLVCRLLLEKKKK